MSNSLSPAQPRSPYAQLFRYGLVGIGNNLLGYVIFLLVTYLGMEPTDVIERRRSITDPRLSSTLASTSAGSLADVKTLKISRELSEEGKACITCHQQVSPGQVSDWKDSRHAHAGVTCIDCHEVGADSPTATQHETLVGTDVFVSVLVPPSTCARCHPAEMEQFIESGHFRSYRQIIPKDSLHALVEVHEGRNIPELKTAPGETGCMQCHGTEIKLDEKKILVMKESDVLAIIEG